MSPITRAMQRDPVSLPRTCGDEPPRAYNRDTNQCLPRTCGDEARQILRLRDRNPVRGH